MAGEKSISVGCELKDECPVCHSERIDAAAKRAIETVKRERIENKETELERMLRRLHLG